MYHSLFNDLAKKNYPNYKKSCTEPDNFLHLYPKDIWKYIQGAIQIKEKVSEAIFIFILAPSMEEIKNRLIKRGCENEEQMIERFKKAYREINELTKYNYVVVNDVLEEAVNKVNAIITSEKCRVDRIEDVYLSNEEEIIHELLINKNIENKEIDI